MSFDSFFVKKTVEHAEIVVSERFKDASGKPEVWKVRSISAGDDRRLHEMSYRTVNGKNGKTEREFDSSLYASNLIAECVVYPNLNTEEFFDYFGVATAAEVVEEMLTPGEYNKLADFVLAINDFGIDDKIEEAKNS